MAHYYSVTVDIEGKTQTICSIVPGNEELAKHVQMAQDQGIQPRGPTTEEIRRAADYFVSSGGQNRPSFHSSMHRTVPGI